MTDPRYVDPRLPMLEWGWWYRNNAGEVKEVQTFLSPFKWHCGMRMRRLTMYYRLPRTIHRIGHTGHICRVCGGVKRQANFDKKIERELESIHAFYALKKLGL